MSIWEFKLGMQNANTGGSVIYAEGNSDHCIYGTWWRPSLFFARKSGGGVDVIIGRTSGFAQ